MPLGRTHNAFRLVPLFTWGMIVYRNVIINREKKRALEGLYSWNPELHESLSCL